MSTPDAEIAAGREALAAGRWEVAEEHFRRACAAAESPEALEGLAFVARWSADERQAFACAERGFRLYRQRGDSRGAARLALMLADDTFEWRGEIAVARGWLRRARRLLESDERSEEYGRLLFYEGNFALLDGHGILTALDRGRAAAALGADLGSPDIEMLGLALEGLALVSAGDVEEGMARLDEAATAAIGGEIRDPELRGTACCFVIDACGRVRDFDRGAQWSLHMEQLTAELHMAPFFAVCRPNYAQVLLWRGRWPEAEHQLLAAIKDLELFRPPLAVEALVRLAELRARQGRFAEAAELYRLLEGEPLAQLGRAALALATGDPGAALDAAHRFLRRLPPGARAERAAGIETLVAALVAAGDLPAARDAAVELRSLATVIGTPPFLASADFAAGAVAAAAGDLARAQLAFEDAVDRYGRAGGTFDCARARLELATVLAAEGRAETARVEALAALDVFARVGAEPLAGRARALLDALARTTGGAADPAGLSPREREVLRLIAAGQSNAEIAESLVLSVRTVERHISNIYAKLGASGPSARAAAVAYATRHGLA